MKRALLIVMDSVGCGGAADAADYGDAGADTLRHVLDAVPSLRLPTLWSMGLGHVLGREAVARPTGHFGVLQPQSPGKDSTTGHWELAGVVLDQPFGVFDRFPAELVDAIGREADVRFIGNVAASGTAILDQLGPEHCRTGRLILYTSADSVLQIAAHEAVVPLPRLYAVCEIARRHADAYRIGRVIARPFVGEPGAFARTAGRHDFSLPPPPTVVDALAAAGVAVTSVGKTADLFAGRGFAASHPTASDADGMATTARLWAAGGGGLTFVNLVDFDTLYGHRRDTAGYAAALAAFDRWLGGFLPAVGEDDLLVVTADHGNDPTWPGTDHTRERVPVLVRHGGRGGDLGDQNTFADVAATVAAHFGVAWAGPGRAVGGAGERSERTLKSRARRVLP